MHTANWHFRTCMNTALEGGEIHIFFIQLKVSFVQMAVSDVPSTTKTRSYNFALCYIRHLIVIELQGKEMVHEVLAPYSTGWKERFFFLQTDIYLHKALETNHLEVNHIYNRRRTLLSLLYDLQLIVWFSNLNVWSVDLCIRQWFVPSPERVCTLLLPSHLVVQRLKVQAAALDWGCFMSYFTPYHTLLMGPLCLIIIVI